MSARDMDWLCAGYPALGLDHLGGAVGAEVEAEMLACLKAIAANEHVMHWAIGQALNARIRRVIKEAEGEDARR